MKKSTILLLSFCVILLTGWTACSDDDDNNPLTVGPTPDATVKGIYAFVANAGADPDILDVSFEDNTTILLTTRAKSELEAPVDITKVTLQIDAFESATVTPDLSGTVDLTNDLDITIRIESGESKTYKVRVVVTPPYPVFPEYDTNFTELWQMAGTDLNLRYPNQVKGMAVTGDYLAILDNGIDMDNSHVAAIKLYNKNTGAFVKNIPFYEGGWSSTRSYSWSLETDEAGHLVMGRINSGGAGFMLDFYDSPDGVPFIMLNSMAGAALPDNTGKKVRIVGNLKEGKAYVYASVAHYFGVVGQTAQYCVWEFNDGVPTSVVPQIYSYGEAGTWYNAAVQRESLEDPTLYIAYTNEDGYPSDPFDQWENLHKAHFNKYVPGSASSQKMNPDNFAYRMLDSRMFKVDEGRFMVMLQQSYSTVGGMSFSIFNITNPGDWSKVPASEGYDNFRVYHSAQGIEPVSNDWRFGTTAVSINGNDAYIYVYYPNPDPSLAQVKAIKMTIVKR